MAIRRSSSSRDANTKNLPDLLAFTPKQLVGKIPLGRDALYDLARRIGFREGRRYLIARDALEAWLRGEDERGAS